MLSMKQGSASSDLRLRHMTNEASSSAASSSATAVLDDIIRLIAPDDRAAYRDMLAHKLHGRSLEPDELRRLAVTTWHAFCKHGWPRDA
jgi:hypothetical protein